LATSGNIYITQGLPVNDDGTAKVSNTAAGGTPGKFTWGTGQTLKVGTFNYNCLFTPDDTDNYETKECSVSVKFVADEVTGVEATIEENGSGEDKLYTSYSLATLGDDPWNLSVKLVYKSGQKVETSDYTVKVLKDGSLQDNFHAGTNTVKVESNEYDLEDEFTVEVIQAEIDTIKSVDFSQGTNKIYPNTPLDDIEIYFTIKAGWNYNTGATIKLTPNDFKLVGTLVPGTGTSSLSIVYTKGGAEQTYSVPKGALDKITVDYLTYDVSGITFTGGSPITYNGQPHSIEYSGTLPEGVGVQYTYDGTTQSTPFSFTGAGDYEITLSFTQDDTDNYEVITKTITATLKIIDAVMTDITVDFEQGDTVVYPSTDLDTLKDLITVTAAYNNGTSEEITDYDLSGMLTEGASTITVTYGGFTKTITVTVTAIELDRIEAAFTQDGAVYPTSALSVIKPWLTVTAYYNDESEEVVSTYELSGEFTVGESEITVTYGGKDYVITVDVTAIELVRIEVEFTQDGEVYPTSALSVLKPWLTVTAYYNDESDEVVSDYELTGAFTAGASEITVAYGGLEKKISVEVTDVAIVSVDFSFTQDGVVYPSSELEVLRQWLTVTATLNNGATDEIENYELTGEFIVGESEITVAYGEYSQTITVEVSAIAVDYIEAQFTQGGVVYHTTELGVLKDWLTVTAYYTDGTSQEITDYELSGAFTVGASEITVTYGAEHTDTVTVTVDKVKVTLPTFKGGLNYTGVTVKPTVDNFNGYDSALMTFVTDKLQSGLTVGSYKAVFALNDPENYEWATATTYKKSVFAAVVFDNETEVILNANEAAVDWNIARAVLTATKSDGALPVFASESFIGALSDVVAIKYFKDEACTEEVAAADLAYETQYFVKAELLDTDNFELDTSAAQYTVKSFTYTTPAKELTLWDKIVKFVVTNWLWLVIAVVALILFITIIALIARAAKKKREREEQRRLEEKEEKKREQEERKLEREERMARLSQQQAAMPQMMMPQMMGGQMPMQQSMPQAAQPMAAGGASSSEIAELKAELKAEFLAIKVDQNSKDIAANEIAQLRSEVSAMRNEMTFAKRTDQISGMPVDVLTEALTVALKNVLGGQALEAPKAEQAKKEEVVPVAAQVPPDAIMTTVTTTKIDTTKKPAQSAPNAERAAAPVRTVVRNLVAPMPVDDGRVFDVGGFYKPADPMTDMEPVDDEKGE
ncbi:MAG: bacterial Ig-like domain-containing protein, partial [Clostridia bacterium]|nr:bacterial Ig-like domain-containing protein [Clostridia bacterium]